MTQRIWRAYLFYLTCLFSRNTLINYSPSRRELNDTSDGEISIALQEAAFSNSRMFHDSIIIILISCLDEEHDAVFIKKRDLSPSGCRLRLRTGKHKWLSVVHLGGNSSSLIEKPIKVLSLRDMEVKGVIIELIRWRL